MSLACLSCLLSHWRYNPIQLVAYITGLALATGLWSGVQAINTEARASYAAAASMLGHGQFEQLVPQIGNTIKQQRYIDLRRSGWLVTPVIEGRFGDVRLLGIDLATSPINFLPNQGSAGPVMQSFFGSTVLFANAETAKKLDGLTKAIVDTSIMTGVAITDVGTAQRLLKRRDLTRLIIIPEQPLGRPDLLAVAPDLRLQSPNKSADIGELTDSFHFNLTTFGLLCFAVGLFIVHSTIGLAFEQRLGMMRTMRSLGVPLKALIILISTEMLLLASIGAGLGIFLGYFIAAALLPDVAATVQGLYGAEISGTLQFRQEWWLSGFIIAILGTTAALISRLIQVAKMPLLASVQPRAWAMNSSKRLRLLIIGSLILFSASILLSLTGKGLITSCAILACLLIGSALALPILVERTLIVFQRLSHAAVWEWFWADTRQQVPGLSLALMALLLAISANIGVTTMVSSFRLTFLAFLDQRLAPELFVQVDTQDKSIQLEKFLINAGVEILPLLSTQREFSGQSIELYGVRVGSTYRQNWAFLGAFPNAWNKVQAGHAIIVNEQLARRANLWLGDPIKLTPNLTLPIAAVVADYGNPLGQMIVAENKFKELYPDIYPQQFGIRTQDVTKMRSIITEALGITDSAMVNQTTIKTASVDVFERTFRVTAALNALTLIVAAFALWMSLLTLADLRVPQLAPVWTMGLTNWSLGKLEMLRSIMLAALVFFCAIPLGLIISWVLLNIVNTEAFGWRLPMFVFPYDYARLGLYTIIAAVLAAAWPVARITLTPPAKLLKVFANEH